MTLLIMLFWTIFPVVAVFAATYLVTRFSLRKRFHIKPVDIAVPLLFLGLHGLTVLAFKESVLPYYLISVFLLAISVALFQAYFYEEILFPRYIKMFWRMTFIMTVIVYLLFIVLGFIHLG